MSNTKEISDRASAEPILTQDTFGQEIRQLRNKLGLTQRELGALTGLHGSAIAHVEKDNRAPFRRYSFWQALPQVPGITEDEIMRIRRSAGIEPSVQIGAEALYGGLKAKVKLEVDILDVASEFNPDEKAEFELIVEAILPDVLRNAIENVSLRRRKREETGKKIKEIRAALASERGASGGDAR